MMQAALCARRIAVVAPHPDDEAIGAWGLIRRARRLGMRVHIIVVSDGGASHPGSAAWPRTRLIRERQQETRRAMRNCKLTPSSITFLSLPDGALCADDTAMARALAVRLRRFSPDLIVGPARNDDHADHRAVAETLARLRMPMARKLAYQVWPLGKSRGRFACSVPLSLAKMAMKRCCLRGYRTQSGVITDAKEGFAMSHHHLAAFVRPRERFHRL